MRHLMSNDRLRKLLPALSLVFFSFIVICILYHNSIRYPILDQTVSYASEKKDMIAATQFSTYQNNTEVISLTVINNDSRYPYQDITGISIQFYYKGQWYSLKEPNYGGNPPPANGISISYGEEISLEVGLKKYGLPLREGHYRAAVEIIPKREYVTAEFDITK